MFDKPSADIQNLQNTYYAIPTPNNQNLLDSIHFPMRMETILVLYTNLKGLLNDSSRSHCRKRVIRRILKVAVSDHYTRYVCLSVCAHLTSSFLPEGFW
jgi:hypothetical protein